jgi:hypothetical protein
VYDIAESCAAELVIVWATAPAPIVQERMLRRHENLDVDDLSDADWGVYLDMRRKAEPIRRPHLVVNTSTDIDSLISTLVQRFPKPGPAQTGRSNDARNRGEQMARASEEDEWRKQTGRTNDASKRGGRMTRASGENE